MHYSVVEFEELDEHESSAALSVEVMTDGAMAYAIGERYIVQDNMMTFEEHCVEVHDMPEDAGERLVGLVVFMRTRWEWLSDAYIRPAIEPDPPNSDGLGLLRARLRRACKAGVGFLPRNVAQREAEMGGGFVPDKALGALYPADAQFF